MFHVTNPVRLLREYRQSGLADGPQWLIDTWGGSKTASGERVSIEGSMAISDVFSAVSIIAEDVSQLPFNVYRDLNMVPGNSRTGVELATDHRNWRMLHDMPNPYVPAHRFWSTVAVHQLLWGNWFLEKLRGPDGLVAELRLIHPGTVEVEYNPVTGQKRFIVTRYGSNQERLSDDRVLHGFGLTMDGLTGMSPITQARESLGTAKARGRFEADVYGQAPYLSGVIKHPGQVKDRGVKIRESWKGIYGTGGTGRGGVAVLEEGSEYQQLAAPLADMQFVENARLSKTEIAVLFKLPPAYFGGETSGSLVYETVEGNKIQKATMAIAPVANNIAQFVSRDMSIFPFQSWYAEFNMEGLLRGDSKTRAEVYKAYLDMNVIRPEWIAEKENFPPPPPPKPVPTVLQPSLNGDLSEQEGIMSGVNGNG